MGAAEVGDLLAGHDGSSNTVAGTLNSNTSTYVRRKQGKKEKWVFVYQTHTIRLLYNPSGGDEGTFYEDQKAVTTDLSGSVSFGFTAPCPLSSGDTATATRASTADNSAFSELLTVG